MAEMLSLVIARILAIIYLSVGIGLLSNKKWFKEVIDDMSKSPGLNYVTGFVIVVLTALVVHYHNIWSGWPIIITIFAWIGLIKGITFIICPSHLFKLSKKILKARAFTATLVILLGFLFAYWGFFA